MNPCWWCVVTGHIFRAFSHAQRSQTKFVFFFSTSTECECHFVYRPRNIALRERNEIVIQRSYEVLLTDSLGNLQLSDIQRGADTIYLNGNLLVYSESILFFYRDVS